MIGAALRPKVNPSVRPERRGQNKAAGEVLTAKQAPHRPGTAPALGLRAGSVAVAIIRQTASFKEHL